jgi:hypothetical protein
VSYKKGIVIFLIFVECTASHKFKKIQKLDPEFANLYILRPPSPILGFYKFKFQIDQYEGHFKNQKIKQLQTFSLDNSEYCFFKYEEGYYNLIMNVENLSKIVYLEKEKDYYFQFEIINRGFFSLPEYFIRNITKEEAIKLLVDYNKLNQCSGSMD